jgi:serine/threonine protein kinase
MDYETGYKIQKNKSNLSYSHLYELLLVKQIDKTEEKFCFISFINENQTFYYVETIDKSCVTTKETFKKLLHEKNIAISIKHPLILRLVKTFSDMEFVYNVYENFMVNDFSVILNKPLTEDHAKFMTASLFSILEYLHERNIIYREFNPIVLKLTNYGYPFISNLRSAKVVKDRTNTRLEVNPYTAPEMIVAEGYNKAVNYWNLGVMIYQFLYNSLPFEVNKNDIPFEMYGKILKGELVFPPGGKYIRANELISHLLQKDYKSRAGLDDVKYSRWLDAIDWQRIKSLGYEAPIKPQIMFHRQVNLSKCVSLTRHVHEMLKQEAEQGQGPKKINKNINWDNFF